MADLVSDVSDVRFLRQSGPHFSPSGRPKLWRFADAGPTTVARRTPGPAYANLQWRKPRLMVPRS